MKNMELNNMIFAYKIKDWYLSYVQLNYCKIINLKCLGFLNVASPETTRNLWADFKGSYTTASSACRISGLIKVDVISNAGQMQSLDLENLTDCNLSWFDDYFHCCVKQIELLVRIAHEISVGI